MTDFVHGKSSLFTRQPKGFTFIYFSTNLPFFDVRITSPRWPVGWQLCVKHGLRYGKLVYLNACARTRAHTQKKRLLCDRRKTLKYWCEITNQEEIANNFGCIQSYGNKWLGTTQSIPVVSIYFCYFLNEFSSKTVLGLKWYFCLLLFTWETATRRITQTYDLTNNTIYWNLFFGKGISWYEQE